MTTAFQTVIDYAETISINKQKKVAQTISRDGVVRSTSLGGQSWEFEVALPDGMPWSTMRPLIEQMETLDRVTAGVISINRPGQRWLSGYQGNYATTSSITASFTSGNTLSLVSGPVLTTGNKFVAGDFIQLGTTGKVYSVAETVPSSSSIVTLHRPVRDSTGTYSLIVGQAVKWTVICTEFPRWEIFSRDQVRWSGPFRFAEVI
jgi:hypothetical protein